MGVTIQWEDMTPERMAATIIALAERVPAVAADVAASEASRAEEWMTENAPWEDRSGNARQGLFGTSAATRDGAEILIGHTMEYGPFLELGTRRMHSYPIVMPAYTMFRQHALREYGLAVMELFRG